jgi:deoxyribonuclease-4
MRPMEDLPRIGAHLPLGTGMLRAARRAQEIGATAIQIFGDNPTAWRRRAALPPELPEFRACLAEVGVDTIAIHAAYLVNLAGADPAFVQQSIAVLAHDLSTAPAYGARYVNVHTGSHRDTSLADGIARLADGVASVLDRIDRGPGSATLLLENSAGGGFGVGVDVEQLGQIADAIAARGVGRGEVGFCLDTAHLWAAGVPIGRPDGVDALIDTFELRIGLDRLRMIHLNDSKSELGSRLDRHEHVGAGQIGERALGHLVRHPRLRHVAFVVETPGMDEGYDAVNVGRVRDLLAGRPLATLPPEAFSLRGSRSRAVGPASVESAS